MTINKTLNGTTLTIALEGRLDTMTAPELEAELNASLKDAEALKAALEAAKPGIEVLVQATRGLDSFYAERSGLIVGY